MTDGKLDNQIRALMIELVDSTPPAPTIESILPPADRTATAPAAEVKELDLPTYVRDPRRHGRRLRPMAVLVSLLALLSAASFGYTLTTAGGGGADTPEAAVENFIGALGAEDVIGMLESMPEGERVPLREALENLASELERLKLTTGADLSDVAGFDFEIRDLTLTAEEIGPNVVAVQLDGTMISEATQEEFPISDQTRSLIADLIGDPSALDDFETAVDDLDQLLADEEAFLVAVQRDGSWYVSPWYTAAEYLRRGAGLPTPAFGASSIQPTGAATPEGAAQQLIEAAFSADLEAAVAISAPSESRVLYDYAPLWVAGAVQSPEPGPNAILRSVSFELTGSGDARTVRLTGYDIEYPGPSSSRVILDGDCLTQVYDAYASDGPPETDTTCRGSGNSPVEWDISTQSSIVVVEENGSWFVSPVRSAAALVAGNLKAIPDAATAAQVLDNQGLALFFSLPPSPYGAVTEGSPSAPAIVECAAASGEDLDCAAVPPGEDGMSSGQGVPIEPVAPPTSAIGIEVPEPTGG